MSLSSALIKSQAAAVGFDLCGIARANQPPRLARLREWIDRGYAGDMTYLAASIDERLDPARVLPGARSTVALACVYNTREPLSTTVTDPAVGVVSRYAWGDDYHDVLRVRLRALLRWMAAQAGPGFEAFSSVDSGPIQDKVFAEQAGLGWIGKHTCLISPKLGSWLFLGEILTNLDLDPDAPALDQCGTCTRCLDACPTAAIVEPYVLDATRCLAYVTIEARGPIDPALRPAVGRQIVGCDICQDVCPWNRRAAVSDDAAWQARPGLAFGRLLELCQVSDDAWRAWIRGSAMRRAGLRRIRRSQAYAAAHLPPDDRAAALAALAAHPSGQDGDVNDAILWARTYDAGH
jgi:epoxyqueuosine reductase